MFNVSQQIVIAAKGGIIVTGYVPKPSVEYVSGNSKALCVSEPS